MPIGQKRLLFLLAVFLALQAVVNITKYLHEVSDDGRFGGDFIVFWRAAQDVASGDFEALYGKDKIDGRPVTEMIAKLKSGEDVVHAAPFVYPPHALLLFRPLADLSYNQAVAIFSMVSVVFFYLSLWLLMQRFGPGGWQVYTVGGAFMLPFLSATLFSGQTSTLLAALLLAAVAWWDRRPLMAGVCLGLMTVKPQLGLLLPVALLAAERWWIIASATVTVLFMTTGATLWVGVDIWTEYLAALQNFHHFLTEGFDKIVRSPLSPYLSLRIMGLPDIMLSIVQAMVTLGFVGMIFILFRRPEPVQDVWKFGMLSCAMLLATPYSLCYDMPILAIALLPLLLAAWRNGWRDVWEIIAVALLLLTPYAQPLLAPYHVPFALVSLLMLCVVVWRRYRAAREETP